MVKIIKYFIVNKNADSQLVGGHDYGSLENAEKSIPECNIPNKDAKAIAFNIIHLKLLDFLI